MITMARKVEVEGIINLKLEDRDVKKNIDSLKKLTSEMEIDINIDEISKQLDELKKVDSDINFTSNIDAILKQIDDLEKIKAEYNIDANFSEIKQQIEKLKSEEIDIKVKAEGLDKIQKELNSLKSNMINVDVKVNSASGKVDIGDASIGKMAVASAVISGLEGLTGSANTWNELYRRLDLIASDNNEFKHAFYDGINNLHIDVGEANQLLNQFTTDSTTILNDLLSNGEMA
jgi:hypothetical protein